MPQQEPQPQAAQEHEQEKTWPPVPGILLTRNQYRMEKEQRMETIASLLGFFTQVDQPGKTWKLQEVAELIQVSTGNRFEPSLTLFTEPDPLPDIFISTLPDPIKAETL